MTIEFTTSGFEDIARVTREQQQASQDIWEKVYTSISQLISDEVVDEQVGQILDIRNAEFRRNAGLHEESVINNASAMQRVAGIGQEGGGRMRRAAAGGA